MKNAVTSRKSDRPLRVAIIAPPWLKIPVYGYGGVEPVIEGLVKSLVKQGVEVEVFGVKGKRTLHGAKVHAVTASEQFEHILKPMYDFSLPIPTAHVLNALRMIEQDGSFDIIHDHNYFIGPALLSYAAGKNNLPPAVHTVHGPPLTTKEMLKDGVFDNREYWKALGSDHDCYMISISNAMKNEMPNELGDRLLDTVHNAVDTSTLPFVDKAEKRPYFITLARFSEEKGQHIAAKLCAKKGYRLRMAGTVATISSPRKLLLELANPLSKYRNDRDFKYYSDKVLPHVIRSSKVTYSGTVASKNKLKFISEARALLFPILWEEPFGMAVIEALACGTPVIAMKRGALPEIIEHGVNGFLAENEEEFAMYMDRIDEIDPRNCRQSVEERFSDTAMGQAYIDRYREVIAKTQKKAKK